MTEAVGLAAVCLAVAIGATAQRITGIGIALVSAPGLVLMFGPLTAVPLCNLMALLLNVGILLTSPGKIEWRRAATMAAGSAVVILALSPLVQRADQALLQATIGVAVLVAIALTFWLRTRGRPSGDSMLARLFAGASAGGLGAAAGLSGPPLAIYAVRTGWAGPTFVPTLQGVSAVINVIAVAAAPRISIPPLSWVVLIGALGAGAVAGALLAPRADPRMIQTAALMLAAVGAIVTLVVALT
ncbi:TSUP family transporter [Promicromonospora panici]|uniref:TSUP family transporter n=1 Tax=Promicromonospora panici TaxID=2219658 RepID=UPI00101BFBA4|nr:TSUP family transporter [Promicromonospora panici]